MSSICTIKLAVFLRRIRRLMISTSRLYAPAMALAMTKYLHKQIQHCEKSFRLTQVFQTSNEAQVFQAYTNAGVYLNFSVKVCMSGLVPTMATTAV